MKRPLTTAPAAPAYGRASEVRTGQPVAQGRGEVARIVAALVAILEAVEAGPKAGPAMRAHRSALRSQGLAAAALGDGVSMEVVLHEVGEIDPARAERRTAFVREAWTGISERHP